MFTDEDGIYVGGRKPVNRNLVGDSMSDGNNQLEKANELGSSLNNSFVPGVDVPMEYIKATNPSTLTRAAKVLHGLVKGLGYVAGGVGILFTGYDIYKSQELKNSHIADIGLSVLGFYLLAASLTPVTFMLTAGLIIYGLASARHAIITDKSLSEELFD